MDTQSSKAPGTIFAGPMDAIALLVADHSKLDGTTMDLLLDTPG